MTNPFDPPFSEANNSDRLNEVMRLEEYWRIVKSHRNQLYFYLLFGGMILEALLLLAGFILGIEKSNQLFLAAVGVITLGGLAWFGYRVGNLKCYKCGHKLAMGHFFFLKNVRCWGCGFKFNST